MTILIFTLKFHIFLSSSVFCCREYVHQRRFVAIGRVKVDPSNEQRDVDCYARVHDVADDIAFRLESILSSSNFYIR